MLKIWVEKDFGGNLQTLFLHVFIPAICGVFVGSRSELFGRKFRQNRRWEDWLDVRDLPLVTKCPAMASARYRHWGCLGFSLVGFLNTAFCRGMLLFGVVVSNMFYFHTCLG